VKKLYTINSHCLQEAEKAKYLGVLISNDLQWTNQVLAVTKKADGTLGFHRRNLKNAPPILKKTACFSLVRSVLEYGSTAWDPHLNKDIGYTHWG